MSDLELERKESLTRAEVAKRLSDFADALAKGNKVELDLGGTSLTLRVADDIRAEFEVEVDGDEIEVEIELKWSTATADGERPRSTGDQSSVGTRGQKTASELLSRVGDCRGGFSGVVGPGAFMIRGFPVGCTIP